MNLFAEHKRLRVATHGIAGQHDDESGNQIALWPPIPLSAQPHAQKTSAPPDNAHGRVLQVIFNPCSSPAMLRESVYTTPNRNDQRVEKFLAPAGPAQPILTDDENDGKQDAVGDEGTSHDKVGEALSEVVPAAEAHSSDTAKQHLGPANHGHHFADQPVRENEKPTNLPMDSFGQMQLEIRAQHDLHHKHEHEGVCKRGMDVLGKPTALVGVAKEERKHGDDRSDNLEGDMPSGAHDLELDRYVKETCSTLGRRAEYRY